MILYLFWIKRAQECWMTSNVTSHIRWQYWRAPGPTSARTLPFYSTKTAVNFWSLTASGTFKCYALHARSLNGVWKPLQKWENMCAHHFDYFGFLSCSLFLGENVLSEHDSAEQRAHSGARHRADFNHSVSVHVRSPVKKQILSRRHYVYGVCRNGTQPPYTLSIPVLCSMYHVHC